MPETPGKLTAYGWNRQCLLRDGKPWLPFMGEFHYARVPRANWREELYKMKACGVEIVASYVFWLFHERAEGCFDFTGQMDLRAFLNLCREVGLKAWIRIGPWCHGEARNGGFPDWLMQKGIPLRSNDPRYLALVKRYWRRVSGETEAALHQNGGAVIGIQIENEYGHCGGEDGDAHMDTLLALAREIGLDAPYFTATGWGGARIGTGGILPVMGCYCDAPWDSALTALPPNCNYVFSHERNDVDIGSDFRLGEHLRHDTAQYPFLTAEMGGSLGPTFHRRPVASVADTGAMTLCKLGSGANLLGYYMFHGGTNPCIDANETRETDMICETPALSYYPHAPIGEYGQIGEAGKELKLFAMFVRDFGERLAPLPATIPEDGARTPMDTERPRYALRARNGAGFLFVNNHQRGLTLSARIVDLPGVGKFSMPSGYYAALPLNLPIGGAMLRSAHAMPLCILNGKTHVFWCDGDPQYDLAGELGDCEIVTLTRREALDAWRVTMGGMERLVISSAPVIADEHGVYLLTREAVEWRCVPDETGNLHGKATIPRVNHPVGIKRVAVNYQCHDYELEITCDPMAVERYLRVAYAGSMAELFVDGQKVADDMYDGSVWEIGLSRFGFPTRATLRLYALFEGMPVWLQCPPAYQDGRALRLDSVTLENEYRTGISGLFEP